jgi:hypothetical protein
MQTIQNPEALKQEVISEPTLWVNKKGLRRVSSYGAGPQAIAGSTFLHSWLAQHTWACHTYSSEKSL